MKSIDLITFDIEEQKRNLELRQVKPIFLILGQLAYSILKDNNAELCVKVQNEGMVLKNFKGLRVVIDPETTGAGIYKPEQESVVVVGR